VRPVKKAKEKAGERPTESITAGKDVLVAAALAFGLSSRVAAAIVALLAALPFLVSYVVDLRRAAKGKR